MTYLTPRDLTGCTHTAKGAADFTARSPSTAFERFIATKGWKKGTVTSTFKKGKKEDPGNYRPDSLTSTSGQALMEQTVLGTVSKHMKDKQDAGSCRCGFMQGNSYSTTLTGLYSVGNGLVGVGRGAAVIYLALLTRVLYDLMNQLAKYQIDKRTMARTESWLRSWVCSSWFQSHRTKPSWGPANRHGPRSQQWGHRC